MACRTTSRSCGSSWGPLAPGTTAGSGADQAGDSGAASASSRTPASLALQALAQERHHRIARNLLALAGPPMSVLESAGGKASLGDHDTVTDAEQLRVGKLDARALVAVVVERLDASGFQLAIERIGDLADARGLLQIERHQYHMERSDRIRPDDSPLIMILFNGRSYDARHTDAIAAHQQRHGCP